MTSEIRANTLKNRVGLGTIEYSNTGPVISGVTTASNFKTGTSNLHSTGLNIFDLDVDGHTNLDNVSIAGVSTFSGNVTLAEKIIHDGDPDTYLQFTTNTINLHAGGTTGLSVLDASVRVPTKLGINGAAPQTPLDVIANGSGYAMAIRGRSSDNTADIRFTSNDYGTIYGQIVTGPTYLNLKTGGQERLELDVNETTFNNPGADTDFRIRTPAQTHMFYVNAGNDQVTIKTSNAQSGAVLTVNGRTHIDTQLTLGSNSTLDAGAQATIYKPATNTLAFATAGANERLRIDSGGDVTVNTGTLYIPQWISHVGDTDSKFGFLQPDIIQFDTAGTTRLKIMNTGQIRIDQATSANNGIRMRPSGWNYDFRIGAVSSSGGSIWLGQNYEPTGGTRDSSGYGTNYIRFTTGGDIYFGTGATDTNPTQRLRIDSSGNTHFGSSGTLNSSNTVSIIPSDGRISFGMDGRTSYVTGENSCYIYSGEGSSGTTLAGELILQSRSNVNRNITFVTGATPTVQMIVYGSGGVYAITKNNFLQKEFQRHDTSSQFGALSTSFTTDNTISATISNYQRGQRIIVRATVPCGIALQNGSGANYAGTSARIKVTNGSASTYSNDRTSWYRADGNGTHETTQNLFICLYITENNTDFSNGNTLTVTIEGKKNGGAGTSTHYLGGWSSSKEITVERYEKSL